MYLSQRNSWEKWFSCWCRNSNFILRGSRMRPMHGPRGRISRNNLQCDDRRDQGFERTRTSAGESSREHVRSGILNGGRVSYSGARRTQGLRRHAREVRSPTLGRSGTAHRRPLPTWTSRHGIHGAGTSNLQRQNQSRTVYEVSN